MDRLINIEPLFSEEIPATIEPGIIYISEKHKVAIHLCACGCGERTVTLLGNGGWALNKNNNKITLRPSIGNWSGEIPYHAHYYITENKIEWL